MNPFSMPSDLIDKFASTFVIERNRSEIGVARGIYCGSDYPSTIQIVEDADIHNGDWLIDRATKQKYFAKDVTPIIVDGEPVDWMVKYQTERDYNLSERSESRSFINIQSVSGNSVIGNQENVVLNIGSSLTDIERLISKLSSKEQTEANDLLKELKTIESSNHPVLVEGALSKFSNLLKKHSDLFIAVGGWAVQLLIGK